MSHVAVFACGNPSRGDDAVGPGLMDWLEHWQLRHPEASVSLVESFQLQVEHTLDLQACDLALFVDASATAPDPYEFQQVIPALRPDWSTHALSPESLLQAYGTLGFGVAPPAFSLGVRGHVFGLGKPMSPQGKQNQEAAWNLLERLLEEPRLEAWERESELATCS